MPRTHPRRLEAALIFGAFLIVTITVGVIMHLHYDRSPVGRPERSEPRFYGGARWFGFGETSGSCPGAETFPVDEYQPSIHYGLGAGIEPARKSGCTWPDTGRHENATGPKKQPDSTPH